jgi:hypothetical protein
MRVREKWPRLETIERFAEGLLQPVRFQSVPVNASPAWRD